MTGDYYVIDPKMPLAGCLSVVATKVQYERIGEIEKDRKMRRFFLRSYLSDHIPLCGGIGDIIARGMILPMKEYRDKFIIRQKDSIQNRKNN